MISKAGGILTLLLIAVSAVATDRALLIGVEEYIDSGWPQLPGISKDLRMMQQVCDDLGFRGEHVKMLRGRDATRSNILSTIYSHLIRDTQPGDRVILYYSGHGFPRADDGGDEEDGFDETLVPADATRSSLGNVSNLITDDELNRLIRRIPTRWTWVLVDACNSGTVSKGLSIIDTEEWVAKRLPYGNIQRRVASRGTTRGFKSQATRGFGLEETHDPRFISFSAAEDHQDAMATPGGSLFTMGFHAAIRNAAETDRHATFSQLEVEVTAYIKRKTRNQYDQDPVLSGDESAYNINIFEVGDQGPGTNWEWFKWMEARTSHQLGLFANKTDFLLGEDLVLEVDHLPKDGYLNVITVDADDQVTVLYPNKWDQDNRVHRGATLTIPSANARFHIPAMEPKGAALVMALFTAEPLNLYTEGGKTRDVFRQLGSRFARETLQRTRGFNAQKRQEIRTYGARLLRFNIF